MDLNSNIRNLVDISRKKERKIIGLMSGTSLDGLDVAYCSFEGSGCETIVKLLRFNTVEYTQEIKIEIRKVFGKKLIDLQDLCVLNAWIGTLHAEMVLKCLKVWNLKSSDVDIIASHGQTIFHAPKSFHKLEKYGNSTLQIGDGDHIAVKTGIITLSDFRQKNIAAGGEGAPLALYGDFLLFSMPGEDRIMLNIGGIANFTFLPGSLNHAELLSTDTGPGNTLLDAFSTVLFSKAYDKNGDFAKVGQVNQSLLHVLKNHDFFSQKLPKTTGPELFNPEYVRKSQKETNTENISSHDLMATLTQFTAETIFDAIKIVTQDKNKLQRHSQTKHSHNIAIFTSGGGSHNIHLISLLQSFLKDCEFHNMDSLGISGDAKEAVLFATLANECISGKENCQSETKNLFNVSTGKISFPL